MQTSKIWTDILRKYNISSTTTEPYHPHQNPAERKIRDLKQTTNQILDRVGAPSELWFYALKYVSYLYNHTSNEKLKWKTPIEKAFGNTPDISSLLEFYFYQPIYYYEKDATSFPESKEHYGHWLGISENCGDEMTYYVLTNEGQVISRSVLRPAEDKKNPNKRKEEPELFLVSEKLNTKSPDFNINQYIGNKFTRERDNINYRAEVKSFDSNEDKFLIKYANGIE